MAKVERFEEVDCWKKAREIVNRIFVICHDEKLKKDYAVSDQIRRASLSVMNNIAEGFGRFSNKEFIRYLDIAQASSMEVRSLLYVLLDFNYITKETFEELYTLVTHQSNQVLSLIKYLRSVENKY